MKTNLFLKTLSKACCAGLVALMAATGALAQSSTTFSRPGNSMYYEHTGTTWLHKYNSTFTYNSKGNQISSISVDPITNQNLSKTERTYDQQDKTLNILSYKWQNNTWVLAGGGYNRIPTFNQNNQLTEDIWQNWIGGAFTNTSKVNYTYDAAGHIIEEINSQWSNNAWRPATKYNYVIVNGLRTEKIRSYFNQANATWTIAEKTFYAGWHIPNVRFTSCIIQEPDANGTWVDKFKSTTTMGPNNSYVLLNEYLLNGTWLNSTRETNSFDSQGNKTGLVTEEYQNGSWVVLFDDAVIFTYNTQFDMLQRLIRGQDVMSGPKRDKWKEVYSNFQYFPRALGTAEAQSSPLSLNVYPNPATDKIQIELTDKTPQTFTATVSDVTGKIWQTRTFRPEEIKQLDLTALPIGIYLLKIQTENGSTVKRIVKQ